MPEDPTDQITHPLDRWVISRVHQLTEEVTSNMKRYDLPNALAPVLPFIDDASNWYVRCSRKRFWKSENDDDKNKAYQTLHYILVRLSIVLAPFTPFLSEELYRQLTAGESVHLLDWPEIGHIDELILSKMSAVRHLITIGLSIRADKGLKVRQPLTKATLSWNYQDFPPELLNVIQEELNVKRVVVDNRPLKPEKSFSGNLNKDNLKQLYQLELDTKLTTDLKHEGQTRELIRYIQNARKQANLSVDDRINLLISTTSKNLAEVVVKFSTEIAKETLAKKIVS
ncbi:class I tRNA ligase family protein, partial [Candidatus Saccharibacteria bacterium]|nr:class I tRNA ligase family protein [Candidatus Saccharibacteria bacterium]